MASIGPLSPSSRHQSYHSRLDNSSPESSSSPKAISNHRYTTSNIENFNLLSALDRSSSSPTASPTKIPKLIDGDYVGLKRRSALSITSSYNDGSKAYTQVQSIQNPQYMPSSGLASRNSLSSIPTIGSSRRNSMGTTHPGGVHDTTHNSGNVNLKGNHKARHHSTQNSLSAINDATGSRASSNMNSLLQSPTRNGIHSSNLETPRRSSSISMSGFNSPMSSNNVNKSNGIKVVARFRPENEIELKMRGDNSESDNFNIKEDGTLETTQRKGAIDFQSDTSIVVNYVDQFSSFTFDRIFPPEATQQDIFDYSINETVQDVLQGYNGTILAYGQTGSGKTYTMMGKSIDDAEQRGLIPRIADTIFDLIMLSSSDIEYTVGVSYMEIYMEKIRDLLDDSGNSTNLHIHEDKENGVHVKGLSRVYVTSPDELHNFMKQGSANRSVSSTKMNEESSRSHAIFQIIITQKVISTGLIKRGSLFLVDLAGSEKVAKTGASGQTLEEAKKINSSLSSLGHVINALTDGKSQHIPYRDSKLTRILQESIGGNSRTSLIINCSPSSANAHETLSTLRFGSRAKKIKNRAHINTELSTKELKKSLAKLRNEGINKDKLISKLVDELWCWRNGSAPANENWVDLPIPTDSAFSSRDGSHNESKVGDLNHSSYVDNNILARLNDYDTTIDGYEDTFENLSRSGQKVDPNISTTDIQILKENEDLKREITDTQAMVSNYIEKISELEASKAKESEIVGNQRNELAYLKSQLDIEKLSNGSLNNEIEALKNKLRNKMMTRNDKQRIFGLEKALDQLSGKLEDMATQNQILKKDIATTRSIAETRNDRIKTLEMVVKTQQTTAQSESLGFEKKLGMLSSRIQTVKRLHENNNKNRIITSPMSDSRFNYSSLMSPTSPIFESTFNESAELEDNVEKSISSINVGELINTKGVSDNSESKSANISFEDKDRSSKSIVQLSDISGTKKGLNFRIVKPLRGGNGSGTGPQSDAEVKTVDS
ncbi:Smy1 protein [Saccharomycopsis crataegensis]|uniref:Kinesin-like protein n=1 Tax=Saccharomycopsis crataegensis TaxID=43959 RepID=A0AAV5QGF1_9ASCO|nr:Smy1 protein [Saccharomycopsis crataegensis]